MYGTGFYTRGLASPVWPIPLFLLTTPLHILFHLFLCDGGPSCLESFLCKFLYTLPSLGLGIIFF